MAGKFKVGDEIIYNVFGKVREGTVTHIESNSIIIISVPGEGCVKAAIDWCELKGETGAESDSCETDSSV